MFPNLPEPASTTSTTTTADHDNPAPPPRQHHRPEHEHDSDLLGIDHELGHDHHDLEHDRRDDDHRSGDGTTTSSTTACGTPLPPGTNAGGGKVGLLLISRYIKPNSLDDVDTFNHFSLLKSIEDLFGLKPLGYARDSALPVFDAAIFNAFKRSDNAQHDMRHIQLSAWSPNVHRSAGLRRQTAAPVPIRPFRYGDSVKRIYLVGAAIAALLSAGTHNRAGVCDVRGQETGQRQDQAGGQEHGVTTKLTCDLKLATQIPSNDVTVTQGADSGTQFGWAGCGKPLFRGVEQSLVPAGRLRRPVGQVPAVVQRRLGLRHLHAHPEDTGPPTTTSFTAASYTGTVTRHRSAPACSRRPPAPARWPARPPTRRTSPAPRSSSWSRRCRSR